MKNGLTKKENAGLLAMAERAVSIQKGEKRGRWTREMRVSLVYSALCSLYRISKEKKQ